MGQEFLGFRLKELREIRGHAQSYLAGVLGVTPATISSWETGAKTPGPKTVLELARCLGVGYNFFQTQRPQKTSRTTPLTYRKLARTTQKSMSQIDWVEEWLSDLHGLVAERLEWPDVVVIEPTRLWHELTLEEVEDTANAMRRAWGMGDGPISNLGQFLENNGIVWTRFALPSGTDGVSNWRYRSAFVVIAEGRPAARDRFSMAHELGHIVLHRNVTEADLRVKRLYDLTEEQANRFAGAFLFPATSYAREIRSLNIDFLVEAKLRWKMSCQSLVYRGKNLGLFSDDQINYFYQNLIRRTGSRTREPKDDLIPREDPMILGEAIDTLQSRYPRMAEDLMEQSGLSLSDFCKICGVDPSRVLGDLGGRIVAFRPV